MVGGKADFYRHLLPPNPTKGVGAWYLSRLSDDNCRIMAPFRMRCHGLVIDIGAWGGYAREDRLCPTCLVVDDEEHFLFDCRLVRDLRARYVMWDRAHGDDRDCLAEKLEMYITCGSVL